MKKSLFYTFILLVIMFFAGNVNALTETGTLKAGNFLYYNGTSFQTYSSKPENPVYPTFVYKHSDSGAFLCISGLEVSSAIGYSCPKTSEPSNAIAHAYIINELTGVKGGVSSFSDADLEKYYWLDISSMYFEGTYAGGTYFMQNVYSSKNLSNGKTMETTHAEARAYQTKYSDAKYTKAIEFVLTSSSLEFTYNEDGNFYSQKIYVTDKNQNSDNTTISIDNKNFVLIDQTDEGGRYFQVKISKDKARASLQSVNVTVLGSYEYYKAELFDCTGFGNYQNMLSTKTNKISKTGSVKASGEVGLTSLIIEKVDEKGNNLAGVEIKVESEDKTYSETFITTDEKLVIENLKYGKYNVIETKGVEGYIISDEVYTATLSKENLNANIIIKNNLTRVEISKFSESDNKLLAGAVLQIQDEDGNVVKDSNGRHYEWTTTEEVYVIEGLVAGKYYLVEKSAPEGYELNKDKVEFIVNDTTEVIEVVMKNNLEVKVPDTLSSRSTLLIAISMFDIALGIGILTYVKKNKVEE